MKTFVIALATFPLACFIGPAQATVSDAQREVVSFADLNLENETAKAVLRSRINFAARSVCGLRTSGPLPIELATPMQRCVEQAKARAIADIDTRRLTGREEVVVHGTLVAGR